MWISRYLPGRELCDTRGYWKILHKDNDKYASRDDLTRIRSLVLHPKIAPELLDYTKDFESTNERADHPFKSTVTVFVHRYSDSNPDDGETSSIKYEVIFWNGASINQCHSFKICRTDTGRTNYYQYFEAGLKTIKWLWYDNNYSRYKEFELGSDVNEQLECSLQANLIYNFPTKIHSNNKYQAYFNCSALNILKREYLKKIENDGGNVSENENKTFLFRATFREDKSIRQLEQVTVTAYSFPRSIQRRDTSLKAETEIEKYFGVLDYCHKTERHFNLRMKPISLQCSN